MNDKDKLLAQFQAVVQAAERKAFKRKHGFTLGNSVFGDLADKTYHDIIRVFDVPASMVPPPPRTEWSFGAHAHHVHIDVTTPMDYVRDEAALRFRAYEEARIQRFIRGGMHSGRWEDS